jgi:hypothetical protein
VTEALSWHERAEALADDLVADGKLSSTAWRTGTGYNAALLTHRLGDKNVFSIDIDPCLVASASRRLADLGYRPTLAVADGASGLAEYAPYDGIIVTCAVRRVPWALVEQTADNGWLLLDVKIHAAEGNLVLLHRQDGRLVGRFDNGAATFMQMRTTEFTANHVSSPERDRENVAHRVTDLNLARPWEHRILWFLLHLNMPGRVEFGYTADPDTGGIGPLFLYGVDGSWCEVSASDDGTHHVWQAGPRYLWDTLENLHDLWTAAGRPGWERFGLTVTAHSQTVWLDDPQGPHSWSIL